MFTLHTYSEICSKHLAASRLYENPSPFLALCHIATCWNSFIFYLLHHTFCTLQQNPRGPKTTPTTSPVALSTTPSGELWPERPKMSFLRNLCHHLVLLQSPTASPSRPPPSRASIRQCFARGPGRKASILVAVRGARGRAFLAAVCTPGKRSPVRTWGGLLGADEEARRPDPFVRHLKSETESVPASI